MKRPLRWLITVALLCCISRTAAQQVVVSGKVTGRDDGKPLQGVMVTVRPAGDNKIVQYTQTSTNGMYEIKLSTFPENHILHFAIMGHAVQTIPLVAGREHYDVQLPEQVIELKEVIVKAPGIRQRGDTITYVVSNFADTQDKSLADVLKKMPGIEVEKSGAIKYNGVSINKFYIEGRDMLEGRYNLATNNIHQKDVGSVEVMENHQPIKALEDISFSQNPAINIRLKEDAKSRWVGTVKAGTGFTPFLWNAELFLMRFTPGTQTLDTYKTNNTGTDVARESMRFSVDEIMAQFSKDYRLANYIDVRPDYLTDIDAGRARFNKSHLFSTNNLWAVGKNSDLTSQVSYTDNRLESDNFARTTYFLIDSAIITEQGERAVTKQNRLSADLALTTNMPGYYLKNKLNADFLWDDMGMDVTGTFPNTQSASVPERRVSNDFELLSRSGNRTYTLNSYNLYQWKPQHLHITRENDSQRQEVHSSAFYTNTNTSLAFYVNPVAISMKMGIIGVARNMESTLSGVSDTLGTLNNELSMRYFNMYVSPEAEYKKSGLEAKFDMPVSFAPYRYRDNLAGTTETASKFLLSPRLYVRYHFTSRLSASVSGRLTQNPVEEQLFYSGLLLQDYRNLTNGIIDFNTGTQKSLGLNIAYRNPLKAFFANAGAMQLWNESRRVSDRIFLDEFILTTYIPQHNTSRIWMLDGNISKGVDAIRGMVSVRSSYMGYDGSLFQNGIETPYSSAMWSITPKVNSRITGWLNISYELNYTKNSLEVKEGGIRSSSGSLWQTLSCNFTPGKKYYIQLTGEHYHNRMDNGVTKQLLLADAGFTYNFSSSWEVNLAVKNIFNQETYGYTSYDGLTSINKEYRIRPRNILASVFFRF